MTTELPAEAIEAAANALFDDNPVWHLVYDRPALWPEVAEPAEERYREQATAALTAAAPFIRAQALEYAAQALGERGASRTEGRLPGVTATWHTAAEFVWNCAEHLRTRAKTERGSE